MKFIKLLTLLFILMVAVACSKPTKPEFAVGQEWSYKARETESTSTLIIGAIENHPEMGEIFHISVNKVKVINPRAEEGLATEISHLPVSKESLMNSVLNKVADSKFDKNVEEGINTWREANGGVFSITVAEAIEYIEEILSESEVVNE